MTTATTPNRIQLTKGLAFFGGLAIAVGIGTFMLAGLLAILGDGDFKNFAGAAPATRFLDLAVMNGILAIACASAGALALLVAAALYALGRLRPRA